MTGGASLLFGLSFPFAALPLPALGQRVDDDRRGGLGDLAEEFAEVHEPDPC